MLNPILGALNPSRVTGSSINQLAQMVRSISNPQMMLQQLTQSDPALYQAVSSSGGDYEKAFRSYAQAKGVDANDILNQIKGMM